MIVLMEIVVGSSVLLCAALLTQPSEKEVALDDTALAL